MILQNQGVWGQMTWKSVDKDCRNALETSGWFFENLSTKKLHSRSKSDKHIRAQMIKSIK